MKRVQRKGLEVCQSLEEKEQEQGYDPFNLIVLEGYFSY
jgi:hypothetical protein